MIHKILKKILFIQLIFLCVTGCVSEQLREQRIRLEAAQKTNTIQGYEEFQRDFPGVRHLVKEQLDELRDWQKACELNTVPAYKDFALKHKTSIFIEQISYKVNLERIPKEEMDNFILQFTPRIIAYDYDHGRPKQTAWIDVTSYDGMQWYGDGAGTIKLLNVEAFDKDKYGNTKVTLTYDRGSYMYARDRKETLHYYFYDPKANGWWVLR